MGDCANIISQLKARADMTDSLLADLKKQLAVVKIDVGQWICMERNICTILYLF